MTDFYHLPSSCSVAVKATLAATGEEHTQITVDLASKSAAFLAANPLGKVPALVVNGQALTEGGAINLWLSARHPDAGLMPDLASPEGAEALKWLFFAYASLHPVWVRIFYPERFGGDEGKAMARKLAVKELLRLYALVAAQLEDSAFIAGDTLSLADLYLAATIHWEGQLEDALTARWPVLADHRDRVRTHPGIARGFAGEFGYAAA